MGRDKRQKGHDTNRDSGPFVAMPLAVLDCPAYLNLSHPAARLLMDIARQYRRDNNGQLLASRVHLLERGWKSHDTVARAVKELVAAGFIHQTVMGHRPNKASWYAVTWRTLDRHPGYDHGAAESFVRGAYKNTPLKNSTPSPGDGPVKNKGLSPGDGPRPAQIGPGDGLEGQAIGPGNGPIRGVFGTFLSPSDGHQSRYNHLDGASARAHAHHNDCVNHAHGHEQETHAHTQPVHAPGSPSVVPWDGQTCNAPETRTGLNDNRETFTPMVETHGRGDTNGRGERLLTYTPASFAVLTIDSG